ncbi:MAG: nucleotide exchange factor GrpE [Phycisphaeraceae bacterium]|nr:nucleotide exchange factor GrpE [Phycisphaeraceae bacterium]
MNQKSDNTPDANPSVPNDQEPLPGVEPMDGLISPDESPAGLDLLAALEAERDDLRRQLLRATADYQNLARRSEQNLSFAREQQIMELGRAMVTVLDHFGHALAVDPNKTSTAKLLEGLDLVRVEMLKTLEKFGIREIHVEPGQPFNPNCHEALMRQTVADIPPDHVVQQLQPGYVLGDRTLRPAKVIVAAAPTSEAPSSTPQA